MIQQLDQFFFCNKHVEILNIKCRKTILIFQTKSLSGASNNQQEIVSHWYAPLSMELYLYICFEIVAMLQYGSL